MDENRKKINWLELAFALFVMVGLAGHFYSLVNSMYIVNNGFPQEVREGVAIKLAVEFAKGNNPYSIAYNECNVPIINHYGWFTGFFLSIFIRIVNLFTVARPEIICVLVTLGVIAIGCAAMWFAESYQ